MNSPTVFFIDDDEDDKGMFLEAVREVNPSASCGTANSAEEALALLKAEGAPVPDFIFLDLNMPGIGGKECLAELKKMSNLSHVPVIVFTTSRLKKDKDEAEKLGASGFFTKPDLFEEICMVLKNILEGEWMKTFSAGIENN